MGVLARVFEQVVNATPPGTLVSALPNRNEGTAVQPATHTEELTGEDIQRDVWVAYDHPHTDEIKVERLMLFAEAESTTSIMVIRDEHRARIACVGPHGSEVHSHVYYPRGGQTANTVRADAIVRIANRRGILGVDTERKIDA